MSDRNRIHFALLDEAETVDELLHLLVGAASVCWSEPPSGVFDTDRATQMAARARERIGELITDARVFDRTRAEVGTSFAIPDDDNALVRIRTAQIVAVGGGGGGHGGNGGNRAKGQGGGAGKWASGTFAVEPGDTIDVDNGAPGRGGAKEQTGTAGGATIVRHNGAVILEAPGGTPGPAYGNVQGASPGWHTEHGHGYQGGWTQTEPQVVGNAPGGGGGGGNGGIFGNAYPGADGATGGAWIRLRNEGA